VAMAWRKRGEPLPTLHANGMSAHAEMRREGFLPKREKGMLALPVLGRSENMAGVDWKKKKPKHLMQRGGGMEVDRFLAREWGSAVINGVERRRL